MQQIKEYVGITKLMKPQPTLLVIVSPHADCAELQQLRQIVDQSLDCGGGRCVEVAP